MFTFLLLLRLLAYWRVVEFVRPIFTLNTSEDALLPKEVPFCSKNNKI